jgi:hypothetical protein
MGRIDPMANCHEMRKGEVYVCEQCGVELQVVAECRSAGAPAEECKCHPQHEPCTFSCCGQDLKLKK